jgi:hypothetical protein
MNPSEMTPEQRDPEARFYGCVEIGSSRYKQLCRDALEKQTVRFAIAPGQSVVVLRDGDRGQILNPYEEIKLSDMNDPTLHPEDAMSRLVGKGLVLEKAVK